MVIPRFHVRQKIRPMVNRYEVLAAQADGSEGPLLAFAQQKRMALRGQVFVDTASRAPVLSSERVWAVRDPYDVRVPDPRLDFRVAASMAVALDALQSR
jgi:hypothetical protein